MNRRERRIRMNKTSTVFYYLSTSFDGERVHYGDFESRMAGLMKRIDSGPEIDFFNFTRDMTEAMKHEDERKKEITN